MKTFKNTKYLKNILLLACLLFSSFTMFAQEDEEETKPKFSFSGSVGEGLMAFLGLVLDNLGKVALCAFDDF